MTRQNAPAILLGAVVAASIVLFIYGITVKQNVVEKAQLPTTLAQLAFIFVILRRPDARAIISGFSRFQKLSVAVLLVYITGATIASDLASAAAIGTFCIVHLIFFVTVVAYARIDDLGTSASVWTAVGVTALIHVVAFFISWIGWPDMIRDGHFLAFNNIRHLGYFLAPAAVAMAIRYVIMSDHSALSLCCYLASAFYLIYSGSRGGAVAVVGGLVIISAFCLWHQYRPNWTRVFILIGLTFLLSILSELVPTLPWKPLFGRGVDAIGQTGTQVLGGRAEVWGFSIDAIKESPMLGYGPALLREVPTYLGKGYFQPHNIGLQFLLHWGIVGTVLIMTTVIAFTGNAWGALARQPARAIVPFAVFVTMCIHGMVDGGLFYPYSTVVAIIAFASLVGIGFKQSAPTG